MRLLALIATVLVLAMPAHAQEPVDAQESFEARQADLVTLAGHLGAMHGLQQLCGSGYSMQLYRDRMQELVRAEVPMGATRLDMIAAFNSAHRDIQRVYLTCSPSVQEAREARAKSALVVVERLYAPFR